MGGTDEGSRSSGAARSSPSHPLLRVVKSPPLRRLLLAYLVFNTTEWATWIAILVWAFDSGGASAAGLIAVFQLVPATLVAPFAASMGDRMRRDRALSLGYAIQAASMLTVGVCLVVGAPTPLVFITAAVAATSIVLTRPVHNAIVPEIADSPAQITAGNSASSTLEGVAVFLGPLLTGVLLELSGPGSVFLVLGTASIGSALITWSLPLRRVFERSSDAEGTVRATISGLKELRRNAGALLLTWVVGAQFVVIGVLDILTVVLGIDVLGMGPSGPGILTSALGVGGLVGAAATVVLIGRQRLSPAVAFGMLVTGIPVALVAWATIPPVAWVLLAMSGLGKAFVDVAGRTLLQRAVPPATLSRIFGVQESLLMGGTAVGSAIAPLLVAHLGARGAFLATGIFLPAVGLLAWTQIRRLDAQALQPGPSFGLFSAIPLFAALPQRTLEQLSRQAGVVSRPRGAVIFEQGSEGDLVYVVAQGSVNVIKSGKVVAVTSAGGYFGEIALLREVPRTATISANEDVVLYTLGREEFLTAVTGSSQSHEIASTEARRRLDDA